MACAETGDLRPSLSLGALGAEERDMVAERFGAEFAEARANGIPEGDLLGFARCDLNGVPPAELIAIGRPEGLCRAQEGLERPEAGCGVWALAFAEEGWVEVLETVGRPRLSSSFSNGWSDLVVERGGPPAVFKFDGQSYVEDLGEIDLEPDVVSVWEQDIDPEGLAGRTEIPWFAIDDAMPETAEAVFLWFYINEILSEGGADALPVDFRIGVAELDGAEPVEVAIRAISAPWCAADGCPFWLYAPVADAAPELVAELRGFDLKVARTGAEGMRDLILTGRQGLEVWRRTAGAYVRSLPGSPAD